jgi:hypothetical protein
MTDFHAGTPATAARDYSPAPDNALFAAGLLSATLTARKVPAIVALAWDGPQLAVYTCPWAWAARRSRWRRFPARWLWPRVLRVAG